MTGIAAKESNTTQFGKCDTISSCTTPFDLFGKTGMWPKESYDGGSHVGIMMVPTKMDVAFDFDRNMEYAIKTVFVDDKIPRAQRYEQNIRQRFPALPALTTRQTELNALVYYGPAALIAVRVCTSCPGGVIGPYYVPSGNGKSWVVNKRNDAGTKYVDLVLGKLR